MRTALGRLVKPVTAPASAAGPYVALEHVESATGRLVPGTVLPIQDPATDGGVEIRPGDVLFGKLRPYLAKTIVVDRPGLCSSEFVVMRPSSDVDPRWLQYLLLSPRFVDWAVATSDGVKMPRTTWTALRRFAVELPSPDDQRGIVQMLDGEVQHADKLQALKRSVLDLLTERHDAVREALLAPPAWANWPVRPLGRVFRQIDEPGTDDLPMLAVTIGRGVIPQDELGDRTIWQSASSGSSKAIRAGDLAYNKMRMWQGAVGVAPMNGRVSSDYVVLRGGNDVVPSFYAEMFKTKWALAQFAKWSRGMVDDRLRLYWDQMKALRFAAPAESDQLSVVARLRREQERVERMKQLVQRESDLIRERQHALIEKAMSNIPVGGRA
jgi:type I restriction enzyme, S subunit